MTANEFVVQLRNLQPSEADMAGLGLSSKSINDIRKEYVAKPRPNALGSANPLLDLCLRYELSNIQLGPVMFLSKPEDIGDYWYLAKDGGDALLISHESAEILVMERYANNHILDYCAASAAQFLDALIPLMSLLNRFMFDDPIEQNRPALVTLINHFADLAGGDKYVRWWHNAVCPD